MRPFPQVSGLALSAAGGIRHCWLHHDAVASVTNGIKRGLVDSVSITLVIFVVPDGDVTPE